MICYVLAMGKQHLGPHVVVGYGIKIFWPGLFITSPDHLAVKSRELRKTSVKRISLDFFMLPDYCKKYTQTRKRKQQQQKAVSLLVYLVKLPILIACAPKDVQRKSSLKRKPAVNRMEVR